LRVWTSGEVKEHVEMTSFGLLLESLGKGTAAEAQSTPSPPPSHYDNM
jgi:hypothetical protein